MPKAQGAVYTILAYYWILVFIYGVGIVILPPLMFNVESTRSMKCAVKINMPFLGAAEQPVNTAEMMT